MLSTEQRRSEIVALIHAEGRVRVSELSARYGISEVSIRKDLEHLEMQGQLSRIHGGAVGQGKLYVNMDLAERAKTNASAKRLLAKSVAALIEDNDTVMMNAGTTLSYVLHALQGKRNITLVTNSLQNAMELASHPGFKVILLGGDLDTKYQFTYGIDTITQLEQYHANKCIISVDGIHKTDGMTLYYANESAIVRKMIAFSDQVIVVADSTKLGKSTFSRIGDLSDVDVLVTNKKDDSPELDTLEELGVEVYQAE